MKKHSISWITALLGAVLLLGLGCGEDPYVPPVCNGCKDMYTPDHYIANLNFIDYEGKTQVWPYTVTFNNRYDDYKSWPAFVYQTVGTLPDGSRKYWYSWSEPVRRKDGMLTVTCVDGAELICDFTSIQIQMIKTVSEPLTQPAHTVIRQWEEYQAKHDACPKHRRDRGNLSYWLR